MGKRRGLTWTSGLLAMALSLSAVGPAAAQVARPGAWLPTYPIEPQTYEYLDLFGNGIGYATVVYTSNWKMLRTEDFGTTWSETATPLPVGGPVAFATPEVGYLADDLGDTLYVTRDAAQSWSPLRVHAGRQLDAVDAAGLETVVTGTKTRTADYDDCRVPEEKTILAWSNDGGRSWRENVLSFYGAVSSIDVLDSRTGVAIVHDKWTADRADGCMFRSLTNAVYVTRNGGASWRRVMRCREGVFCTAATMADRRTILVGTNEGALHRSVDGGKTFDETARFFNEAYRPLEDQQAFWVAGIGFGTREIGYASTKGGGTYRTIDGGETWAMEASTELVWGVAAGDLAVAGPDRAVAGGPNFLITRLPEDG